MNHLQSYIRHLKRVLCDPCRHGICAGIANRYKLQASFTLCGRSKVDGKWKLYCMVHNIEKLGHHGLRELGKLADEKRPAQFSQEPLCKGVRRRR